MPKEMSSDLMSMLMVGSYEVRRLNEKLHLPEVILSLSPSQLANEGFLDVILVSSLVE